jgi:1-phosphatidylinositol-3-phosphate 5-kinase
VEEEFVKNICNKIKALHPDLILVQQNVCRLAQDILSEAGICIIQNVKEKNLRRISRFGFFQKWPPCFNGK